MVQKADKATQERLAKLEKELEIEKESSQAAMLALKKELDVEKESSKAALKQVLTLFYGLTLSELSLQVSMDQLLLCKKQWGTRVATQ